MKVKIIEISSNKLITELKIILGSINSEITEKDYFDEAWTNAVQDKTVNSNERFKYRFELVE